jgi:hypothetical protein
MKVSPFSEANSCSVTKEIPNILWNPSVYYRVHKSPPRVSILRHSIPGSYISNIHFDIILPSVSAYSSDTDSVVK